MTEIYIHPGQLAVSKDPALIRTLLGSCVAVALWDPVLKAGGMNHYLLPDVTPGESSAGKAGLKYGTIAVPTLIRSMEELGARRDRMLAKVFGGANVLSGVKIGIGIGVQNIETALRILSEQGIPVVEQDTGGMRGRKLKFYTETFEILQEFSGEKAA